MAKEGYRVFDSDMHIMEPPDLWQRYTDTGYRDRAPIGRMESVGDLGLLHPDGRLWGRADELQRLSYLRLRTHQRLDEVR